VRDRWAGPGSSCCAGVGLRAHARTRSSARAGAQTRSGGTMPALRRGCNSARRLWCQSLNPHPKCVQGPRLAPVACRMCLGLCACCRRCPSAGPVCSGATFLHRVRHVRLAVCGSMGSARTGQQPPVYSLRVMMWHGPLRWINGEREGLGLCR